MQCVPEVKRTIIARIVKKLSCRKGISPVIATLLLVAIAVAASIVTYGWVMSMIKTQGAAAQTGIRIELVEFATNGTTSNDWVNMTIRNVGSAACRIQTIYITYNGTSYVQEYTTGNVLNTGDKIKMCFGSAETPGVFAWSSNDVYNIQVVTDNGFSVDGTYFSPKAG